MTELQAQIDALTRQAVGLPRDFALYQDDGENSVPGLCAWFYEQTRDLTARFDDRNGNDYYQGRLDHRHDLDQEPLGWEQAARRRHGLLPPLGSTRYTTPQPMHSITQKHHV